jgi:hypothetical protein
MNSIDLDYIQTISINPKYASSYYLPSYKIDKEGNAIKPKRGINLTPNLAICPSCNSQEWYFSKIQRYVVCNKCKTKFQSPSYNSNKQNGNMSKKAKSNFRQCFNWLMLISNIKTVYNRKENKYFQFRINFITLTLPSIQKHSDNFIKDKMLQPFLRWLSRSHHCNSYIWKAEAQQNGNIHFHITTNKFIHWKSIRSNWNKILSEHGYCKYYQDGTNDKGDSATQIKAVKSLRSIESYMMKYMCKNEDDKRKINGRLWAASNNLHVTPLIIDETSELFYSTKEALYQPDNVDVIINKRYSIYLYKKKAMSFLNPAIKSHFYETIKKLKDEDIAQYRIIIDSLH